MRHIHFQKLIFRDKTSRCVSECYLRSLIERMRISPTERQHGHGGFAWKPRVTFRSHVHVYNDNLNLADRQVLQTIVSNPATVTIT